MLKIINNLIASQNQIKLTLIIVLILLAIIIFDFHYHINKKPKDDSANIQFKFDKKINKVIVLNTINDNQYVTTLLSLEDFETLRNQINDLDKTLKGDSKPISIDVLKKNPKIEITDDQKVEIPLKLLKQYQKNQTVLEHLKKSADSEKK